MSLSVNVSLSLSGWEKTRYIADTTAYNYSNDVRFSSRAPRMKTKTHTDRHQSNTRQKSNVVWSDCKPSDRDNQRDKCIVLTNNCAWSESVRRSPDKWESWTIPKGGAPGIVVLSWVMVNSSGTGTTSSSILWGYPKKTVVTVEARKTKVITPDARGISQLIDLYRQGWKYGQTEPTMTRANAFTRPPRETMSWL